MPQVTVTVAGRTYRMACGDGENAHLKTLAEKLDGRITRLRDDFGEIGDQRITVMAAITFVDELSEAERRIAALEAEKVGLEQERQAMERRIDAFDSTVAAAIDGAAAGIERAARELVGDDP